MTLPKMKSEFVLQYEDGSFHAIEIGQSGFRTIVRVTGIERAKRFESVQYAISYRSNESHLRRIPLRILELKYEVIDHGLAPINEPIWHPYED